PNYTGSASGTLVVAKADATISLSGLNVTYDGTPHAASAGTSPAGLTVAITYDGGIMAPTDANTYAVAATIDDSNYRGSTTDTLVIAKAAQTIAFNPVPGVTYGDAPFAVSATATSSLPVTFSLVSGPATINGSIVTISGAG